MVTVKGIGEMADPWLCKVDGEDAEFAYRDIMVTMDVSWSLVWHMNARVAKPLIIA